VTTPPLTESHQHASHAAATFALPASTSTLTVCAAFNPQHVSQAASPQVDRSPPCLSARRLAAAAEPSSRSLSDAGTVWACRHFFRRHPGGTARRVPK